MLRLLIPLALVLSLSGVSQAIDCRRASTPSERTICASEALQSCDDALNGFYGRVKKEAGEARGRLVEEQRAWLVKRDRCGDTPECVRKLMEARFRQLLTFQDSRRAVKPLKEICGGRESGALGGTSFELFPSSGTRFFPETCGLGEWTVCTLRLQLSPGLPEAALRRINESLASMYAREDCEAPGYCGFGQELVSEGKAYVTVRNWLMVTPPLAHPTGRDRTITYLRQTGEPISRAGLFARGVTDTELFSLAGASLPRVLDVVDGKEVAEDCPMPEGGQCGEPHIGSDAGITFRCEDYVTAMVACSWQITVHWEKLKGLLAPKWESLAETR